MAPSKRQSHQRHGEPKLFRCTGFGDCNMVFTRSEHLARHARKHTGEKPFRCVVPGCERAFSRFDNMVQHTSTHSKHHDKKRVQGKKQNKTKLVKTVTPCIIDGPDANKTKPSATLEVPLSPPMSSSSLSSSPPVLPHTAVLPCSPLLTDKDILCQHRRLPSITESLYYQSPTTPSMEYFPPPLSSKSMHHHYHSTFLPSPKELDLHIGPLSPISLAISADDSRNPSPTGLADSYWSTTSPTSSLYPSESPSPSLRGTTSRKLSPVELSLPIQELSINHGTGNVGVDVTLDEFEALQGMSQLSVGTLAPLTFGKSSRLSSSHGTSWNRHVNLSRQRLA